jgi:predicted TPR repeat methyltransferase
MTSTSRSYFEEIYRDHADPWEFDTSAYEQRKYAVTVASLPRSRYRAAYEPGCSIGVLTELLATRCDRLLSSDIIASVLRRAEDRLRGHTHVWFEERSILDQWPCGPFDLVVLSKIAYYFDATDLGRVMASVMDSTERGPMS